MSTARRCLVCKRAFMQIIDKRHPPAQACGKKCRGVLSWRNRMAKGEKPGRNHPTGTCPQCGKTFQARDYRPRTFCSSKCWGLSRRRPPKWTTFVKVDLEKVLTRLRRKGQYVAVYLPQHPVATRNGEILVHRLVVEQHIGRYLDRSEMVHHRNAVKDDNRIENLQIVVHALPGGSVLCPHCRREFLVH